MPDHIIIIKSRDLTALFIAIAVAVFLLISITAWTVIISSRVRIAEENIAGLRVDFETTARPLVLNKYGSVYFNGEEIEVEQKEGKFGNAVDR